MNLEPLADRVVVLPEGAEQVRPSGLILPDAAQEKPQRGTVTAVGEGAYDPHTGKTIPLKLRVGDTVLYSRYGGAEVEDDDGDKLLVIKEADILARVKR